MASKKPLALYSGGLKELQDGDKISASCLPSFVGENQFINGNFDIWQNGTTALISAASAFTATLTGDSGNNYNMSVRQIITVSGIGTRIRVKFNASASGSLHVNNASIGIQSSGANTASVPIELTFNGGQSGFLISAGQTIWSDWISFATNNSSCVVIIDIASDYGYYKYVASGTLYQKTSTASYNQASVSGFSSAAQTTAVSIAEVASAIGTVRTYLPDMFALMTGAGVLTDALRSSSVPNSKADYSLEIQGANNVTYCDVDYRMGAENIKKIKGTVSFSAQIYNSTGAAFTPVLFVSTPGENNNFASVATRNNSGNGDNLQSCENLAWTKVTWTADISAYVNLTNGLEFKLRLPNGSLTSSSKVIRLAQFKLERGSVATDFEPLPIEYEEYCCKRYFQKSYDIDVPPGTDTIYGQAFVLNQYTSSSVYYLGYRLPIEMRARPTIIIYSKAGTAGKANDVDGIEVANAIVGYPSKNGWRWMQTDSSSSWQLRQFHYAAIARF